MFTLGISDRQISHPSYFEKLFNLTELEWWNPEPEFLENYIRA